MNMKNKNISTAHCYFRVINEFNYFRSMPLILKNRRTIQSDFKTILRNRKFLHITMAINQTGNNITAITIPIYHRSQPRNWIRSLAHLKLFIISFNSTIAAVVRNQNLYGLDTCVIMILERLPTFTHFCGSSALGKSPSNIASRLVTLIFENSSCCWKHGVYSVRAHTGNS